MLKKLLLIAVLPIALTACKDQEKKAAAPAEPVKKAEQAVKPKATPAPAPVVDPKSPPPPAKANTLERKKPLSAMYDCKGRNFKADFDGKKHVSVLAEGKLSKLSLVEHEKGPRYETISSAKPYVILWDMDKEAIIEVDGLEWMKCTQMAGGK